MSKKHGFKYLDVYVDRHGNRRVYFKRRGYDRIALPPEIGSPEFLEAYQLALDSCLEQSPNDVGVYLLLLQGKVVYVGSSLGMRARVTDHRRDGRVFDHVFYIGMSGDERLALERILITNLRPEGNKD